MKNLFRFLHKEQSDGDNDGDFGRRRLIQEGLSGNLAKLAITLRLPRIMHMQRTRDMQQAKGQKD